MVICYSGPRKLIGLETKNSGEVAYGKTNRRDENKHFVFHVNIYQRSSAPKSPQISKDTDWMSANLSGGDHSPHLHN